MRVRAGVLIVMLCAACDGGGNAPDGAAETPVRDNLGSDRYAVNSGYGKLAWGSSRDTVMQTVPDLVPSKKNPSILVRENTKFADLPASEAYIFGERGLEEVEIRIKPKQSPQDSAKLAIKLDAQFEGTHETSLADDHMYQLAWFGQDTDVRLTYDLRESIDFGPVVTYAVRRDELRPVPSPTTGGTAIPKGGTPGARFSAAIRDARKQGLSLASASAEPGELTLVYSDATRAVAVQLSADPKTGALLDTAVLVKAVARGQQRSAEAAIDLELKTNDVSGLTTSKKAGLEHIVTLHFGAKRWVDLDPKAPNILAGGSLNLP